MKVRKSAAASLVIACVFLLACGGNDEEIEIPVADVKVFEKLGQLALETERWWPGYDYIRTKPAYIILRNDDGTNPRGYLLNPPGPVPDESARLGPSQSFDLDLFRNDSFIGDANDVLGDDGLFEFGNSFAINGTPCFLIRSKNKTQYSFYDEFKNEDDNWVPLVMSHEMFHTFQIAEWTYPADGMQDFLNYPLTIGVMTYELALFDLMKSAHSVSGPAQAREILARYIVLFEEMCARDPSPQAIVKNMGRFQQFIEGSARFVEHFSAYNSIYPGINRDPTHGWERHMNELNSGELIRHIFAVRTWYHVGSGAIHALNEAGVPVHTALKAGNTPYDLAASLMALTADEKHALLTQMISDPGWNIYAAKAAFFHSLL